MRRSISNFEATQWLEPEIASLRKKVEEAEKKVADYRTMKDIPQSGDTGSFAAQQLKDISTELARVRSDGASATARATAVRNALQSGGSVDTLADIANSAMMQKLKETESGIKGQIADLSTTLMNNHPRLKALRSQLGGIQVQIRQETTKILSSIENEAKVAKLREDELVRQLDAAKVDAARTSEQEVGLKALEREAAAQRQLLETYLARYREAASRSGKNSSPADARVISNAIEAREPTFPKILPITIIAALATIILSSITILLMELFSGRALKPATSLMPQNDRDRRDPEPETVRLKAPAANPSEPPRAEREQAVAAFDTSRPEPAVAEAAKTVAAAPDDGNEFTVEAVAAHIVGSRIPLVFGLSPDGDDGSTAMVMLAREIAETGRSVILIDITETLLPTRLMAVDRYLPGVTDLLAGDAAFGDTIHSDRLSPAHIVPRGRTDLKEALKGADRLSIIIGALADAYDLVLVECGAAGVEGLQRLTRSTSDHVLISLPVMDEDKLTAVIGDCADAGYAELLLLSDARAVSAPRKRRARPAKGVAA